MYDRTIPRMVMKADVLSGPNLLETEHLYSPSSLPATPTTVNVLTLLLLTISYLLAIVEILSPLNLHTNTGLGSATATHVKMRL